MNPKKILNILIPLVFLTPLIVLPSSFIFPFIVPKILFLRTVILFMAVAWIVLLITQRKNLRFSGMHTGVSIAVLAFLLSFAISTFTGVDWYRSLWDNHERMLGLFTIVHYVLFFFILCSTIRQEQEWRKLMRVFLMAGSLVMLLGLIQKIQPEFLLNNGSSRVSSTLGNAIYLGGYGLFLAYLGVLLYIRESAKGWKWFGTIGALLGITGIFISGTRGTLLGLIAAAVTAGVLYGIYSSHKQVRRTVLVGGIILVFLAGLGVAFRHTEFVQSIPAVGRLAKTSVSGGDSVGTRLMAWGIAVDAWKDKPVFGWGPNNYYYAFNKFYQPEFLRHGYGETWFDNAHNVVFNTLATQGIVGLVSYFALFLVPLFVLWRGYRQGRVPLAVFALTGAFLVGHFVHNFFVFENPTSYLYFFFILAFVTIYEYNEETLPLKGNEKRTIGAFSKYGVIGGVLLLVYVTNILPARANMATLDALQRLAQKGDISGIDQAFSLPTPHKDDVYIDIARVTNDIFQGALQRGNIAVAQSLYDISKKALDSAAQMHPMDIRIHLQQVQLARVGAAAFQRVDLILEAERILEEARQYSPKRQQLAYELAFIKLQLGKKNEGIILLKQTIEDDPTISEGWWRLAVAYRETGEIEKAIQTIADARSQGIRFSQQEESIITQITTVSQGVDGTTETSSQASQ